jgi:hypothetical protein
MGNDTLRSNFQLFPLAEAIAERRACKMRLLHGVLFALSKV